MYDFYYWDACRNKITCGHYFYFCPLPYFRYCTIRCATSIMMSFTHRLAAAKTQFITSTAAIDFRLCSSLVLTQKASWRSTVLSFIVQMLSWSRVASVFLVSQMQSWFSSLVRFVACWFHSVFSARQHTERAICYRPSVCLSVCHTGGSVKNGLS